MSSVSGGGNPPSVRPPQEIMDAINNGTMTADQAGDLGDALFEAMADGTVTADELVELEELASSYGLSDTFIDDVMATISDTQSTDNTRPPQEIIDAIENGTMTKEQAGDLGDALFEAMADGTVTADELAELEELASSYGLSNTFIDDVMANAGVQVDNSSSIQV